MIKRTFVLAALGLAAMLPNLNAAVLDLGSDGSGFINGALFRSES